MKRLIIIVGIIGLMSLWYKKLCVVGMVLVVARSLMVPWRVPAVGCVAVHSLCQWAVTVMV